MDCSLSGSSVHGIFKARILEWVAISFPRDLPNPEMELMSPVSPALGGRFFTIEPSGKARCSTKPYCYWKKKKKVKVLVTQSCWALCISVDCSQPVSLSMGFSRQEYWSG